MREKIFEILTVFGDSYEDAKSKITTTLPNVDTNQALQNVISWILGIAGMLAVVMIIVSGIQMTTSAGNPGAVTKAKNTLTWSIVGLVIVVMAYAIVSFVIGRVS